ncbi:uncharacterized protein LOC119576642 [Penaeus monodon]|uniref:uncharacterized protein LOC119576642 n=1 Tax=Penaeus monodon TaxID=6687 RepID=UPI0018A7D001|nr:uncharacterized protein LOC119576642 [Penaeus monodon]
MVVEKIFPDICPCTTDFLQGGMILDILKLPPEAALQTQTKEGRAPTKKFDLEKLQSSEVKADFQADLQSKLESVDCHCHSAKSEEVLGFTTKRNKDWFDENNQEIQELLTKKRSAHQAHLAQPSCPVKKAVFRLICSNLQRKLREIQNEWWTNHAEKTQLCADTGDYRGFYEALKAVYGPTHHVQSPLRSADGQALFTDKTSILSRWSEHFQALFSADRVVQDSAVLRIRQKPVIEELDELPSIEEISKAIEQLKCGKAAGVDGIPPEIWKDGGPTLHSKLHELLVCCWEQSKLPRDLRDAVIITLYKNKGEKSDCSNYRGITLLSIAGKVFARVLLNRLLPTIAEDHFPETQCGFRTNRGTTDMVFVLRQLQEKCREQNKGLYVTFVDLTKAFDTVSRKGLWMIMERLGCPPKFLSMVIQLHSDQHGQVRLNSDLFEPFPIVNGVKQGCVLAPTLFSIFFSMMLKQATEDLDDDEAVYIRYRLDNSLFNLRRLHAHTKTLEQLIRDLLFADDAALVAHTERALQRLTSCFAEAAQLFGLEVSMKKTEVLHQPAPREEYLLTSLLLKKGTKISVYRAVILTTLLYGSESWVTYRHHLRLLERFHQRCLRTILNIHWSDYVTNVEVLEQAEIISIEAMLLKSQLCWAGHVSRMEEHRLPKIALYGELSTGQRDRGAPKKRYKDSLKKSLGACHIDHRQWSTLAADRQAWRHTVHQAVSSFEDSRRSNLKEKRRMKKDRKASAAVSDQTFDCSRCGRTCLSRIGLVSHQRACSRRGQPLS